MRFATRLDRISFKKKKKKKTVAKLCHDKTYTHERLDFTQYIYLYMVLSPYVRCIRPKQPSVWCSTRYVYFLILFNSLYITAECSLE